MYSAGFYFHMFLEFFNALSYVYCMQGLFILVSVFQYGDWLSVMLDIVHQ